MRDYTKRSPHLNDVMESSGKAIYLQQLESFEGREVDIDGYKTKALVRYSQGVVHEFEENRRITTWRDEPLKRGSLVTTLDDDRVFLVISEVNENVLHKDGLMREARNTIKWLDPETDELYKSRAIVYAKTLYTTGVKNEHYLMIPNGMIGITLPYNEITSKLDRNLKFILNKTRYRLTFYNEVEHEGIIYLICEEEVKTPLDDMENEIADRWRKDGTDRLGEEEIEPPVDTDEDEDKPTVPEEPTIIVEGSLDNRKISVWNSHIVRTNVEIDKIQDWNCGNKLTITDKSDNMIIVKPKGMRYGGKETITLVLTDGTKISHEVEILNI